MMERQARYPRFSPPAWFMGAIFIFFIALFAGMVGPDWLTPLLIFPAGLLIVRGAWPLASGKADGGEFTRHYMFGLRLPWFARLWGAVAVFIGSCWVIFSLVGLVAAVA